MSLAQAPTACQTLDLHAGAFLLVSVSTQSEETPADLRLQGLCAVRDYGKSQFKAR
jgi:hypothetical protein